MFRPALNTPIAREALPPAARAVIRRSAASRSDRSQLRPDADILRTNSTVFSPATRAVARASTCEWRAPAGTAVTLTAHSCRHPTNKLIPARAALPTPIRAGTRNTTSGPDLPVPVASRVDPGLPAAEGLGLEGVVVLGGAVLVVPGVAPVAPPPPPSVGGLGVMSVVVLTLLAGASWIVSIRGESVA